MLLAPGNGARTLFERELRTVRAEMETRAPIGAGSARRQASPD
jgi:hypothetical protein